ncbi:hypothetical protein HP397_04000 [Streptobacillus felis]|uniref:Restriction endonuclease n=1 Tax=Streptobacillus felis TaxID=1384509 RepID=A0A7Z0T8I7_9FUSO|nr:hypothetical protein [Streptobacillus felis]NYV27979.1 hypothetical protein [Streptobacillus felis]
MARNSGIFGIIRDVQRISRTIQRESKRMEKKQKREMKAIQKAEQRMQINSYKDIAEDEKNEAIELREKLMRIHQEIEIVGQVDILKDTNDIEFNIEKPVEPILEKLPLKPEYKSSIMGKLFSSFEDKNKAQYEDDVKVWENSVEKIKEKNDNILEQYKKEMLEWERKKIEFENDREKYNNNLGSLHQKYLDGEKEGVEKHFELLLDNMEYPIDMGWDFNVAYNESDKTLTINYVLPNKDVIPTLKNVTYVTTKKDFNRTYISDKALKEAYTELIYGTVLGVVDKVFRNDNNLVNTIIFDGLLDDINPATGLSNEITFLSLTVNKEHILSLNLDKVDYLKCFKSLNGIVSLNIINN